ncbi:MAG TPA: twin-arginine translocase TatA/TatE family subunit [Bauldia sp.]|nr:twin-arginine translocase TatA/TatE family subunit [Bauldia sp.]
MGAWGIQHWLVVLVVVLVLFGGRGKISSLMGDFAQGIKSFRKGMADDDSAKVEAQRAVDMDKAPEKTKVS